MTEFEKLYETYFTDVYRYLRKLSGDENIAEEIAAETFFRAMKSLPEFRGDCEVRVWLCQIAKNCYFSFLSRNKRITCAETEANFADPGEIPIDEKLIEDELVEEIHRHLHSLSEPYKEVFMLRVYGEMNFFSIGKIFGKSENWACVTYHRARKMIIKKINKTEG